MDRVHEADRRSWIGEKMKVRDFKQHWIDTFRSCESDPEENGRRYKIMELMKVPESVVKALEEECGLKPTLHGRPHSLSSTQVLDLQDIPDNVDLVTVKLHKQDLDKRASDAAYRSRSIRIFKMMGSTSRVNFSKSKPAGKISKVSPSDQAPVPEVALVVQIFRPIKLPNKLRRVTISTFINNKIQGEVVVLGSQSLTALRNTISCVADINAPGDYSEDPDKPQCPKAIELYKSGFFFIGNTFYNDMTDPSCRDYSEVIREWAKNPRRNVGPFEVKRMEDTCFNDLEIQLGYPYVYVHQGYCEHLIVFSDMRMLHPDDSQHMSDYPMILQNHTHPKRLLCWLCHKAPANWVTYENERVTEDPFFFCDTCFRSYNYTADKKKIGHFRAEPYLDVLI
uniref:snRNA-activating protein complex subunit 3 n=1 Tax=Ixodes ricinus TaxID=34613 RepID=A0A131Y1F6_IXORI